MPQASAAQAEAGSPALDALLGERLARSAPTGEEAARIGEALGSLEATLKQAGEEWCAAPFGSLPSTLRARGSDVDVTCLCRRGLPAGQTAAGLLSEKIGPLFRDHPRFKVLEEVLQARVPILKLRFDDQLDVDLSCQNTRALQNTRLLRGYAGLDERVRSLVVAVKLWAKAAGVCGASGGRLSSYSFTLLAIYFMQVDQEVVLPILPVDAFREEPYAGQDNERIVAECRGRWSCSLSTAQLLERFFLFYHGRLWTGEEVVSVRCGRRLAAARPEFERLRGRHAQRLHIEDPFILERNLNCVLGGRQEAELRRAFAEAADGLRAGSLPAGLRADAPAPAALPPQGRAEGTGEDRPEPTVGTPGGAAAGACAGRGGDPGGGSMMLATAAVDAHQSSAVDAHRSAASFTASTSAARAGALHSPQQAPPPPPRLQQQVFAWGQAGAQTWAWGPVPWQPREDLEGKRCGEGHGHLPGPPERSEGRCGGSCSRPCSGPRAWEPNPDAAVFVPIPAPPGLARPDGGSAPAPPRAQGQPPGKFWIKAKAKAAPSSAASARAPRQPQAAAPPPASAGPVQAAPPVEARRAPASACEAYAAAVAAAPAVVMAVALVAGTIAGVPGHAIELMTDHVEFLHAAAPGLLAAAAQGCCGLAAARGPPERGRAERAPRAGAEAEAGGPEASLAELGHSFL